MVTVHCKREGARRRSNAKLDFHQERESFWGDSPSCLSGCLKAFFRDDLKVKHNRTTNLQRTNHQDLVEQWRAQWSEDQGQRSSSGDSELDIPSFSMSTRVTCSLFAKMGAGGCFQNLHATDEARQCATIPAVTRHAQSWASMEV